mmetsp:Transcript_24166/g.52125  ORF Transcript_24166/g.52125 Transcript_24166/m.52125 type:complete len:208 (-) Transcript_24166:320-943(-)
MTPHDEYFATMDAFQKANRGILGPMIIKGINKSNDDDEENEVEDSEEEDEDKSKYTAGEMASLRYIMITKDRNVKLDEMRKLLLGDQADEDLMCFNTSFSYEVKDGFYEFLSKEYSRTKKQSSKFDLLLGYTYNLQEYDVWMHDNEGDMDGFVSDLAKMWKDLLTNSDNELGIDAEYTRPGILQLLKDFKEKVEEAYSEPSFEFNFE